jgi:DNA-binding MarR family transcriptional regulator
VYIHLLQEEIHKRLHAPELGPCVCSQVRRLARKLSSLYDTVLSPEDLTITQYSLLANIERAGQVGHTVLAEKVGMERTTLTRNLRPLTRVKWVAAAPGKDRRQHLLQLTAAGKAEAGSQFAIVGGSTTSISFSDRFRILAGAQSASCLDGISRHESFYSESRKTVTRAITRKNGTCLCLSFESTSSKASHPITEEPSEK